MTARRCDAVRTWMTAEGLDALLVSSAANVRYLTVSGEGLLVLDGGMLICTDSRYRVQAAERRPRPNAEGGHLSRPSSACERSRRPEPKVRRAWASAAAAHGGPSPASAEVPGIELVRWRTKWRGCAPSG